MAGLSDAYWEGARAGRLVLQRCGSCGLIRHYPQVLCPACRSFSVGYVTSAGTGNVHSWTVTHHPFDPTLRDQLPYLLVTVDMDEGVRVLGRLRGDAGPRIGLPVTLAFEPGPDEQPIPVFTAA